jgi:hypothetical protein
LTRKGRGKTKVSNRPCNYCEHVYLKIATHKKGWVLSKVNESYYAHPPGMDMTRLTEKAREKYFAAWYMELPLKCCC